MPQDLLRAIPSIEQLRHRTEVRSLEAQFGTDATIEALRAAAHSVREAIAAGDPSLSNDDSVIARLEADTRARLDEQFRHSLQTAINATGVIVHTNLGRAPLARPALDRIAEIGAGYSTLEYDVASGTRGRRDRHAETLLRRLSAAEAAVVVNNNAAATLLMLTALAARREVIVSRGELVEIGGGFRVPDVMAQSGALLREVGTTNKTRASDYAAAVSDRTALILRVHPSNFRIEGFTERPDLGELVAVGRRFEIPVAEDLGSGQLAAGGGHPLARVEPTVVATMSAGADICCFSGDKLLGGPQAGIIVGRTALIDRLRRHPLMRALRVDKLTYAALEATLIEYAAGRQDATVPVQRMIALSADAIRTRARAVADALGSPGGWTASVAPGASAIGGGSAPGIELPTWLIVLGRPGLTPDALGRALRALTPPVIARIDQDRVVLDLRTVPPEQDAQLVELLRRCAAQ